MKRWTVGLAALLTLVGAGQAQAVIVVEFDEVVLINLTPLDGTSHYDPWGLSFEDTTYYAIDDRFPPAGVDDYGITTTTGPENEMTVVFTPVVTQVRFDWLSIIGNSIFATAYDSSDVLLQTQSVTGLSGTTRGSFTFSGLGDIAKTTFHDGTGMIGVGRLEYSPIPEPASVIVWSLLGALGIAVGWWTRRRKAA